MTTLLDLLLRRFREADVAPPTPLAAVLAGPHAGRSTGLPLPRLTVSFTETTRRTATLDGGVENRTVLELAIDDTAPSTAGNEEAARLSLRWAAWLEIVLVPEAEREGAPFGGLAEALEPLGSSFEAGGPGSGSFTLRLRFTVVTTTLLGLPRP